MAEVFEGPSPGWYHAEGDPPDSRRYWDGSRWQGAPENVVEASVSQNGSGEAASIVVAGHYDRIAARFIDWCVWIGLFIIWNGLFDLVFKSASDAFGTFIVLILTSVSVVLYEVIMTTKKGATVGKSFVNLRVVELDGSPVSIPFNLVRLVPLVILGVLGGLLLWWLDSQRIVLLMFIVIVGIITYSARDVFVAEKSRTFWDRLAGTMVVKNS
jgi:uncharacterized RDD family membrane protein YckC